MRLATALENRLGRDFVILAPPLDGDVPFNHIIDDADRHEGLLAEIQRLRGSIYLADGAIQENDLTADGRHIQPADDVSWHLLTVDWRGRVTAGIRYLAHRPGISYSDLGIPWAISEQSSEFQGSVRRAVQDDIQRASQCGFSYVELGGWVVGEELRCSTEAIRMLLMMYALSQSMGGALAVSTATTRHNSTAILRRTGGKSLVDDGVEIPAYFDTNYNCAMEVLSFDSRYPNPRYSGWIREFREALGHIRMISPSLASTTSNLIELHTAVTGSTSTRVLQSA